MSDDKTGWIALGDDGDGVWLDPWEQAKMAVPVEPEHLGRMRRAVDSRLVNDGLVFFDGVTSYVAGDRLEWADDEDTVAAFMYDGCWLVERYGVSGLWSNSYMRLCDAADAVLEQGDRVDLFEAREPEPEPVPTHDPYTRHRLAMERRGIETVPTALAGAYREPEPLRCDVQWVDPTPRELRALFDERWRR
jgi:hypothetical protein